MRRTTAVTISAALIAALVTACIFAAAPSQALAEHVSAAQPASSGPTGTSESCYSFAVSALRRHIVVRRRPPACEGLPQAVVNLDVARAIRSVVGPHPKSVARQLASAESRYLASLVGSVRAPSAAKFVAVAAATSSGELALRFSALAAWLAAALAGAYLLAGLLGRRRRRRTGKQRTLPAVPVLHAGLAICGLLIWLTFTATAIAPLAWVDVGLTWVIAGLGMATLLGGPDQQASPGPDSAVPGEPPGTTAAVFTSRAPVVVIAVHGALATLTILLVLLAAVTNG